MRLQFRLRTLLIAVLLVALIIRYFIQGALFYSHDTIEVVKTIGSETYIATVFAEQHYLLPITQLRAAMLWGSVPPGLFTDAIAKQELTWKFEDECIVTYNESQSAVKVLKSKFELGRAGKGTVFQRATDGSDGGKMTTVNGSRVMVHDRKSFADHTLTNVSYADVMGYFNDPNIQEWSVDALEKWIEVNKNGN